MSVTLLFSPPQDDDVSLIRIYHSDTDDGTYSLVKEDTLQPYPYYQNYYILTDYDISVTDYFKISFVDNSGNEGDKSDAINYLNPAITDSPIIGNRWILKERIRRDGIALDRNGEYCNLYLRKTYGEHCSCWDENYQQGSFCESCYGTGYVGGYDVILNAKVRVNEQVPRKINLMEMGMIVDTRPSAWILPNFQLINGDVIERRISGKRYRVADVTAIALTGIISRYECKLIEIDLKDIAYTIGN